MQSQLEALGADTASGEVAAAEFSWRNVAYPVRSESVRAALAIAAAAEAELADAMDTGNGESRLPLLDRLANAFAGARAEIQSAYVNGVHLAHGCSRIAPLNMHRLTWKVPFTCLAAPEGR